MKAQPAEIKQEETQISDTEMHVLDTSDLSLKAQPRLQKLKPSYPSNDESGTCERCGIIFPESSALSLHSCEKHQSTVEPTMGSKEQSTAKTGIKMHKCNFCEKRCTTKGPLAIHERMHTRARTHNCSFCGKSFEKKSNWIQHERTHTGEKPYKCGFCNKGFSRRLNQAIHAGTHTGEKPYMCGVCKKSFPDKSSLKSHLTMHSQEKPHECGFCEKRFLHRKNRVLHERRHRGEKSYLREETYAQNWQLNLHEGAHISEKPCEHNLHKDASTTKQQLLIHKSTCTGEKSARRVAHENATTFNDNMWDKKFPGELHLRTSTQENPMGCNFFERSFDKKASLVVNERTQVAEDPEHSPAKRAEQVAHKKTLARKSIKIVSVVLRQGPSSAQSKR